MGSGAQGKGRGVARGASAGSYLGFSLRSSVIPKLPSSWPALLTFRLRQSPETLHSTRPLPVLSLLGAVGPSLGRFKHTHSLSAASHTIRAREETDTGKLTGAADTGL